VFNQFIAYVDKKVVGVFVLRFRAPLPVEKWPYVILKKKFFLPLKESNYLAEHNMEWKDGNVRQRPGPENSFGISEVLFQFECHLFA
jgi:hypothetical protein